MLPGEIPRETIRMLPGQRVPKRPSEGTIAGKPTNADEADEAEAVGRRRDLWAAGNRRATKAKRARTEGRTLRRNLESGIQREHYILPCRARLHDQPGLGRGSRIAGFRSILQNSQRSPREK